MRSEGEVSSNDQRAFGHDCAHEDIRAKVEPCVSIEDARRRIASMYAGDNVSAEDIEKCARGYLAGWASALPAPRPVAPAWGPLPSAAEVEAHVTRSAPARASDGAPWARKHSDSSGAVVSIAYLSARCGAVAALTGGVMIRQPRSGVWYPLDHHDRAAQWRPVDGDGMPVERGER